jgi:hypothetical protein
MRRWQRGAQFQPGSPPWQGLRFDYPDNLGLRESTDQVAIRKGSGPPPFGDAVEHVDAEGKGDLLRRRASVIDIERFR